MERVIELKDVGHAVIADAIAILLILLVPAISHLVAYPLHAFEPMRVVLFAVILMRPSMKWNAIALAAMLPIVSFAVSGHPVFPKNLVMSGELVVNVLLFYLLRSKTGKYATSVFGSMIISKMLYYFVKYLLISGGLLQMTLFSTSIYYQLGVVLLFTLLFLIYDSNNENNERNRKR